MSSDVTRRDFIKIAGSTAAGIAVATTWSPFAYAANEKVRVACIGTGGQGGFHIRNGLGLCPEVEIVAICDVYLQNQNEAWKIAGGEKKDIKRYYDYKRMLDEMKDGIDAVVIATPLYTHFQITMDCLDAGKFVFCEKTLAYTVDECRQVVEKCHEKGTWLQVGHQRRYNPEYNKAVWLARGSDTRQSVVGRINHVNAQWHRNNDWRRPVPADYVLNEEEKPYITEGLEKHLNWRLYHERSRGGLITELATHQLDVTAWALGQMPARVAAFGGIDYWRDGRTVDDNIVMLYEYDIKRTSGSFAQIPTRNDFQKRSEINKDYTVRLTYSSICGNARRDYSEHIQGDRGSVLLTEQKGCTFYPEPAAKNAEKEWNKRQAPAAEAAKDAAGEAKKIVAGETRNYKDEAYELGTKITVFDDRGEPFTNPLVVDRMQFTSFANDIRNNTVPKANQMVGLMSAVSGFAAVEAMEKGSTVEIDPALYAFDFETPDPFRYDFFEDPNFKKPAAKDATKAS